MAGGQPNVKPGYRIVKDQNDRVVVAEYYDVAGVSYRLRHVKATQDEFVPSSRLHEFPHLEKAVSMGRRRGRIYRPVCLQSDVWAAQLGTFRNDVFTSDRRVPSSACLALQETELARCRFQSIYG